MKIIIRMVLLAIFATQLFACGGGSGNKPPSSDNAGFITTWKENAPEKWAESVIAG